MSKSEHSGRSDEETDTGEQTWFAAKDPRHSRDDRFTEVQSSFLRSKGAEDTRAKSSGHNRRHTDSKCV